MAVLKYLSRDHKFYIKDVNSANYTTEISGISSWEFAIDSNEEDVSTFDNGAWGSNLFTQRTGSLSLEGFYLVDALTGARDSGQLAFEIASMQVGFGAYRDFKVIATTASGGEIGNFTFRGTPSVESFGGSVTDVQPWGKLLPLQTVMFV